MERLLNEAVLNSDPCAKALVDLIHDNESALQITDAKLYHNFPLYRNDDGTSAIARVMVISNKHGIIIFQCADHTSRIFWDNLDEWVRKKVQEVIRYSKVIIDLSSSKKVFC